MIKKIQTTYADIWLVNEDNDERTYCYGGTRSVSAGTPDAKVEEILNYLGKYESGVKNRLINTAINNGVFEDFKSRIPEGFYSSNVGGGRCVFRPKNDEIETIIANPEHEQFQTVIDSILEAAGKELNKFGGKLKLTPDFGRFAGVADILHKHTEHVLGIRCEEGGCGGKASYTSTGINAAIDYFLAKKGADSEIVLIGADGACGVGVLNYLRDKKYNLVGISDLSYMQKEIDGIPVLSSEAGKYTNECLLQADILVATTVGEEFLKSDLGALRDGAVVLLAHNHCLPTDASSVRWIKKLKSRNITVVPGQLLTFGGALTSRIEWFWRTTNKDQYFDKQLAHDAVYSMVTDVMEKYYGGNYDVEPFELIIKENI